MGKYFNLRTDLKGNDVCDETIMFVVADCKITINKGKSKGFFRRGFEYSESKCHKITKSTTIENNPIVFPTGSGMVTIHHSGGGSQYHIFGNVQGFIDDVKNQI